MDDTSEHAEQSMEPKERTVNRRLGRHLSEPEREHPQAERRHDGKNAEQGNAWDGEEEFMRMEGNAWDDKDTANEGHQAPKQQENDERTTLAGNTWVEKGAPPVQQERASPAVRGERAAAVDPATADGDPRDDETIWEEIKASLQHVPGLAVTDDDPNKLSIIRAHRKQQSNRNNVGQHRCQVPVVTRLMNVGAIAAFPGDWKCSRG